MNFKLHGINYRLDLPKLILWYC